MFLSFILSQIQVNLGFPYGPTSLYSYSLGVGFTGRGLGLQEGFTHDRLVFLGLGVGRLDNNLLLDLAHLKLYR